MEEVLQELPELAPCISCIIPAACSRGACSYLGPHPLLPPPTEVRLRLHLARGELLAPATCGAWQLALLGAQMARL